MYQTGTKNKSKKKRNSLAVGTCRKSNPPPPPTHTRARVHAHTHPEREREREREREGERESCNIAHTVTELIRKKLNRKKIVMYRMYRIKRNCESDVLYLRHFDIILFDHYEGENEGCKTCNPTK